MSGLHLGKINLAADLEDGGSADRAGTLGSRAAVLHGHALGVGYLALLAALHTVSSHAIHLLP